MLACMRYNITVVGFFEAMGTSQMDFILNQTEMATIVCAPQYIDKFIQLKQDGLAGYVKNIILLDESRDQSQVEKCKAFNVDIHLFKEVIEDGSKFENAPEFHMTNPMDTYMFSYTSGTTGDSKGVKVSHNMVIRTAMTSVKSMPVEEGDSVISYLPYSHSYE